MENNIRKFREERGWTLAELGGRCDPPADASAIYKREAGIIPLKDSWIAKISKALGCKPEDLIKRGASLHADVAHTIDREVYDKCVQVVKDFFYQRGVTPSFDDAAHMMVALYDIASDEKSRSGKITEASIFRWMQLIDKNKVKPIKRKIKKA